METAAIFDAVEQIGLQSAREIRSGTRLNGR
jgi:hypothetical protein